MRRAVLRWCQEGGATAVEYALLVGLVVLVVSIGARTLGDTIQGVFVEVRQILENAGP